MSSYNFKKPHGQNSEIAGAESSSAVRCLAVCSGQHEIGLTKQQFDDLTSTIASDAKRGITGCLSQLFRPTFFEHYKSLALLIAYLAYFIFCLVRGDEPRETRKLVGITCFLVVIFLLDQFFGDTPLAKHHIGPRRKRAVALAKRVSTTMLETMAVAASSRINSSSFGRYLVANLKLTAIAVVPCVYILYSLIDAIAFRHEPKCLISLVGIASIVTVFALVSDDRQRINFRPVLVGLLLQFVFAILVIRWPLGQSIAQWSGDQVARFMSFSRAGTAFVWPHAGLINGDVSFAILPVLPFFAAVVQMLYHLGWIQKFIKVLSTFVEVLLSTTAGESTACCSNIFLGMTEAPMLIKPFLPRLTRSELHAVMTGGFGTIAGSLMGVFIGYGVEPKHLLAASFMAAPASLALSKLVCPEVEESTTRAQDIKQMTQALKGEAEKEGHRRTIIEAACEGACSAGPVIASVLAMVIAIVSFLALINQLLAWFGNRAGLGGPGGFTEEQLSLDFVASYLFWPIAFVIGIPASDCRTVGRLLGVKIFINEFVAYSKMGEMITSRDMYERYYCQHVFNNQTIVNNATMGLLIEPQLLSNGSYSLPALNTSTPSAIISHRAEQVTTYALCGAANLATVGIQIGSIGSLAPSTRHVLAEIGLRAMLTGTGVNLLNAATAGLLLNYDEPAWSAICAMRV